MTKEEKDAVEKLTNGEKISLISLIRKFKREGIENFITTKPEYIKILLNLIEKLQTENKNLKEREKEHQELNGRLRQYIKELEEKVKKYKSNWE